MTAALFASLACTSGVFASTISVPRFLWIVHVRAFVTFAAIIGNEVFLVNAILQKTYVLDSRKRYVVGLPLEVHCLYFIFCFTFHGVTLGMQIFRSNNKGTRATNELGHLHRGSNLNRDMFVGIACAVVSRLAAEVCSSATRGNAIGMLMTFAVAFAVFLFTGTDAVTGLRLRSSSETSATCSVACVTLYLAIACVVSLVADPASVVSLGAHQTWGGACGDEKSSSICMADIRNRPDVPWSLCEDSFESSPIAGVYHKQEAVSIYAICGRKMSGKNTPYSLRTWQSVVFFAAFAWCLILVWFSSGLCGDTDQNEKVKSSKSKPKMPKRTTIMTKRGPKIH